MIVILWIIIIFKCNCHFKCNWNYIIISERLFVMNLKLTKNSITISATTINELLQEQKEIKRTKNSSGSRRIILTKEQKEWIEDYFMQVGAYALAHDQIYNSNIEQGIIMICTPDLYFQEFKFEGEEMKHYRHEFLKRLNQYIGRTEV